MHYVYIVHCVDGTLYTGYAVDLDKRIGAHNTGRGAKYTAGRRPVSLVYSESFRSKSRALKREYELKRQPRKEKQALIASFARVGGTMPPRRGHGAGADRQPDPASGRC